MEKPVALRAWVGVTLVLALAAGGCPSAPDTPGSAAIAAMNRILAAVPAIGAERIEDITWYDPDNLHEYLDGGAAYYIEAGLVQLAHSEWHAAGSTGPEYVELDIYDMGSPQGALEILADDRTMNSQYLDLGNESLQTNAGVEMRAGRYFVRLTARKDVGGQAGLVRSLAAAVAKAIGPGTPDPALISPLPTVGLVPHSASFRAKGYLGRDFLRNVRSATYDQLGQHIDLFVLNEPAPEDASTLMDQWRDVLPPAPIGAPVDQDRMSWDEPLVGPMMVARRGRWLVGAMGDPTTARPMVDSLLRNLN